MEGYPVFLPYPLGNGSKTTFRHTNLPALKLLAKWHICVQPMHVFLDTLAIPNTGKCHGSSCYPLFLRESWEGCLSVFCCSSLPHVQSVIGWIHRCRVFQREAVCFHSALGNLCIHDICTLESRPERLGACNQVPVHSTWQLVHL